MTLYGRAEKSGRAQHAKGAEDAPLDTVNRHRDEPAAESSHGRVAISSKVCRTGLVHAQCR